MNERKVFSLAWVGGSREVKKRRRAGFNGVLGGLFFFWVFILLDATRTGARGVWIFVWPSAVFIPR